jgi:hypothetical protein
MTNGKTPPAKLLEPGWMCSIVRKPSDDGQPGAVCGEVQAVDSFGVRITGMDWLVGGPCNFDIVVPWAEIAGVFDICTSAHSDYGWSDTAAATQNRATKARTKPDPDAAMRLTPAELKERYG